MKLGAKELRKYSPTEEERAKIRRNPIYLILDNIIDTYNTGAIFRLADAVAAEKIYLCGETLTPPNHRIKKASVDTWQWVPWEYLPTALDAVAKLKAQNSKLKVIAVEQHKKSIPYSQMKVEFPIALVVGHETDGVSRDILEIADQIVEIPMWGVNKSLNVMVSLSIVLFEVMKHL